MIFALQYSDHTVAIAIYTYRQLSHAGTSGLHFDFISQFTNIHHASGTDDYVADALSRIETN